jgi:hypothetical protein
LDFRPDFSDADTKIRVFLSTFLSVFENKFAAAIKSLRA